jgi:hypothetical protein
MVVTDLGNKRRQQPNAQWDQGQGRHALVPPVIKAVLGRTETADAA